MVNLTPPLSPKKCQRIEWMGPLGLSKTCLSHRISTDVICFVLLQIPKSFLVVQILWASPKIWLHLVPLQKLLCWHKNQFYWIQIIFLSRTKCMWLSQYGNTCLIWLWHKKFAPAQNILGTVKGQGNSLCWRNVVIKLFYSNGFLLWQQHGPLRIATLTFAKDKGQKTFLQMTKTI